MNLMGIIFANIYDSSLGQLTNKRTIASLPFGARYRNIDFCLSNMANSAISHVGIITKYNYQSLMNHIGSGQDWDMELGEGGLEFLTPFAQGHSGSYRGKLDALNAAMDFLSLSNEEYIVLADGGVLCAMDYRKVLDNHIASGADVTVVIKDGICNGTKQVDMGVLLGEDGRIEDLAVDFAADDRYYASMGVFVMKRELLIECTKDAVSHSLYRLERDMIMRGFFSGSLKLNAYKYDSVALFNESPKEYFRNNLALLDWNVRNQLFHTEQTIYTRVRNEVPVYFGDSAEIDNCIVGDGCILKGNAVHSVLFRGVRVEKGAQVEDCVIMQDAVIEEGAEVKCCILDKDVRIRKGTKLCGSPDHPMIVERGEVI